MENLQKINKRAGLYKQAGGDNKFDTLLLISNFFKNSGKIWKISENFRKFQKISENFRKFRKKSNILVKNANFF